MGLQLGVGGRLWAGQAAPAVPASAISRFTFDDVDTSGGTLTDSWGSNDAAINGPTTGQAGLSPNYNSGESYGFVRGNGDNITHPTISPSGSWTVSVLLDIDSFDRDELYLYGTGTSNNISFRPTGSNWRIRAGGNDTEIPFDNASGGAATSGVHRFTWVSDEDVDECRAYWDELPEGSASPARQPDFDTFGNPYDTTAYNLGGNADDLRVYDKALSDTEVANLHTTGGI